MRAYGRVDVGVALFLCAGDQACRTSAGDCLYPSRTLSGVLGAMYAGCTIRPFLELSLHVQPSALDDAAASVVASGGWASPACPYSGVVLLGGTMGAYDDADHAWMAGEKQVILDVISAGAH